MPVNIPAAVGASAGGVEARRALAGGLPRDFRGALCTIIHTGTIGRAVLTEILSRAGAPPASVAVDGEPIKPGRISVAPGAAFPETEPALTPQRKPGEESTEPAARARMVSPA